MGREELCLVLPADAADTPLTFADLQSRGFINHPDGARYANDLLKLNFPDEFEGVERLRLRGEVNQIGQIPAPVAAGIGYTLLPRSGVEAFADRAKLSIASLPERRWHQLWLANRRGRSLPARVLHARKLIEEVAVRL